MELRNQSNSNVSSFDSTNDNYLGNTTFSDGSKLYPYATDVSGHYSNPKYGILDFVIPEGWYGSERQWSGDKSINLDLQPGTEDQYLDKLLNSPADEIIPTMTLEANDKRQQQMAQSLLSDIPSTPETKTIDNSASNLCKTLTELYHYNKW